MTLVEIYTDGAASNNDNADIRVGGWGAVLLCNGHEKYISGRVEGATNNQMELQAVLSSLKVLKATGLELKIYTDSQYVINMLDKRYKAKANKKLIHETLDLLWPHKIEFIKVEGHSGNKWNEIANDLAQEARSKEVLKHMTLEEQVELLQIAWDLYQGAAKTAAFMAQALGDIDRASEHYTDEHRSANFRLHKFINDNPNVGVMFNKKVK